MKSGQKPAGFINSNGRKIVGDGLRQKYLEVGNKAVMAMLVLWLAWSTVQGSDTEVVEPVRDRVVRQVVIRGQRLLRESQILAQVRTRAGSKLNEKIVSDDARRIIAMQEVLHVEWEIAAVETGRQVDVIFHIIEAPRVSEINLVGNNKFKTQKLLKELDLKAGDLWDRYRLVVGSQTLEAFYRDKGFYFADVTLDEERLEQEGKVVYVISEGPKCRIDKVKLAGNKQLPGWKIKGKIKSKGYFPIFIKGILNDDKLREDVVSVQRFYHEEGYLDARVFVEKEFNEDKTRVDLKFVIEEGMAYQVASIRFEGNKTFSDEELRRELSLEPGMILTDKRRVFAQRSLERAYGREGYIFAGVRVDLEYTEVEGEVDVVFRIDEDRQYELGKVIITGNTQTRDKVIRRDFDRYGFLPGGIYDEAAAGRAETRLKGSGLFEDVTVSPTGGDSPDERDALVQVKEGRTGMLMMGVGADTNHGLFGSFSVEQRNFDIAKPPQNIDELIRGQAYVGGGQQLRFDFEPGTNVTRGQIRFYEPYLFDQPYYMNLHLFMFRRWREAYLEQRRGGRVTFGHRFDNDWSADITFRLERVFVEDLERGFERGDNGLIKAAEGDNLFIDNNGNLVNDDGDYVDEDGNVVPVEERVVGTAANVIHAVPDDILAVKGSNWLTSIKLGVGRDTTDRAIRPTEGYKLNTSWEQVGVMGGDHDYAVLSAGGTVYRTIYMDVRERKTTWAGKISGGAIIGDAPVFERFYAGGIGSIRGFDYRGVSPKETLGPGYEKFPVGSDYILLGGMELTHPLFEETLFGKLFLDSGMVSEGGLRASVGFGLEIVIPQLFQTIPMDFYFGFPILDDDQDDEEVFSFTFGMGF